MSTYSDLLTRLRKKTGPINLSEIVELLEEQAFPEDILGPGSIEQSVAAVLRGLAISAKSYGAVGDGVTDDTAALVAWIAACKSTSKHGYLPAGTYRITGELDWRATDGSSENAKGFFGEGINASIIVQYTANTPILRYSGRYAYFSGFSLKYVSQQTAAQTAAYCFKLEDWVFFSHFDQILCENGHYGIACAEGDDASREAAEFSNYFGTIRALNCYRSIFFGGANGGTGSFYANVYVSAPGRSSVEYLLRLQNKNDGSFGQLNLEQANVRDSALFATGELTMKIASLHIEGVAIYGNGTSQGSTSHSSLIYTSANGLKIDRLSLDNLYMGPKWVLSLTRSGTTATCTIEGLDQQAAAAGHGFEIGDSVTFEGAADSAWNTTFTITSITATTFSFTCAGTETTPALPASGSDYITATLGNAALDTTAIVRCAAAGTGGVDVDFLRCRDTVVLGDASSDRSVMFRLGYGADSCNIRFRHLNFYGQIPSAHWLSELKVVAKTRTSNVSTLYFNQKHQLTTLHMIVVTAMSDSSFNSMYGVLSVVNEFAITINDSGSDHALSRETTGIAVLRTIAIATRARASNVTTLTTATAHGFKKGHRVRIANTGGTGYADTETVIQSVPTTTSFTYINSGSDETQTAETSGIVMLLDAGLSPTNYTTPSTDRSLREAGHLYEFMDCLSFGTVSAGTKATQTAALVGAMVGDRINFSLLSAAPAGLTIDAYVSATGEMTFTADNPTGSGIASGAILVRGRLER